jgi:hypothetical protein
MPSACSTLSATIDQQWTKETKPYKKTKESPLSGFQELQQQSIITDEVDVY